jgi:hypothetical protein
LSGNETSAQPRASIALKKNPGITPLRSGPSGTYTGFFLISIPPPGNGQSSFLRKK